MCTAQSRWDEALRVPPGLPRTQQLPVRDVGRREGPRQAQHTRHPQRSAGLGGTEGGDAELTPVSASEGHRRAGGRKLNERTRA